MLPPRTPLEPTCCVRDEVGGEGGWLLCCPCTTTLRACGACILLLAHGLFVDREVVLCKRVCIPGCWGHPAPSSGLRSPSSLCTEEDDFGARTLSGSSAYFDMDSTLRREAAAFMLTAVCEALSLPVVATASALVPPASGVAAPQQEQSAVEGDSGPGPGHGPDAHFGTTVVRMNSSSHPASLTSYSPEAFVRLRHILGVSNAEVRLS